MKLPVKKDWLVVLGIIVVATLPTIPSYYFGEPVMYQSHDHVFHLIRLWHIEKAFSEGILIPSWLGSLTFGMGSPVFLFSWFLPYYLGLPLRWFGLSLSDTMKFLFLFSYVASGLTIYLLAKRWTNPVAALAAIPLYLLSPFRLNLIFTRGGPGEAMAQLLIPLSLLFLEEKGRKGLFGLTVVLSLLSLTHNLSYIFVIGMLFFWMLLVRRRKEVIKRGLLAIGLSLLLTAYFWLPALLEREFSHYHEIARLWYQDQFPSFKALLTSPWQYGPPQPERQEYSMSFQIGKIHWLVIAASLIFWRQRKKLNLQKKRKILGLLLLFSLSIIFQLKISKPIWDAIDPLKIFIFPWRLQAISIFTVALLGSFLVANLPLQRISVVVLLGLLLLANRNHFFAARGDYAADEYIKNMGHEGGSSGEFLPIWANIQEYRNFRNGTLPPPTDIIIPSRDIALLKKQLGENWIELELAAQKQERIVLNHYYFPGWTGSLDGGTLTINRNLDATNGRMNFMVSQGKHTVILRFEKTPIRKFASFLSQSTLVFALLVFTTPLWKKRGAR